MASRKKRLQQLEDIVWDISNRVGQLESSARSEMITRVDMVNNLNRRLLALEPAVFPDEARRRLASEVRYIAPEMSDEEVLAIFRKKATLTNDGFGY